MRKQRWNNTFFLGIFGLTMGLGGVGLGDLSAQQTTGVLSGRVNDNHAEIERVLRSSIGTEEKLQLFSETLERQYRTDVEPRADGATHPGSDGPQRPRPCFHQDVTIIWDGVQQDEWGRNEIHGTEGDDVIRGTDQADLIIGYGGEDIICAGDGDDWVYGDEHEFNSEWGAFDLINGEAGDDVIFGGAKGDWLHGSDGEDGLFGGVGQDHLFGDNDNDFLVGMWADDVHHGGNGDDTINAEVFDGVKIDESYGEEGYDTCHVDNEEADFLTLTWCERTIRYEFVADVF